MWKCQKCKTMVHAGYECGCESKSSTDAACSKARRPSLDSLNVAAKWLECNDGEDGEAESCAAVAEWIFGLIEKAEAEKVFRIAAQRSGRTVKEIRRILKK